MNRLSHRDRRAMRLGLFIAAPILTGILLLRPYASALEQERGRLTAERELLAREQALVAVADEYAAASVAMDEGVEIRSPRLFTGHPTLAAGALVRYVANSAAESSVLIEATEARPESPPVAGLTPVRVQVRAVGDIEGLLAFLRRLEDGPRLVHVERLAIERRDGFRAGAEDVQLVSIGATIAGYVLAAPGEAK